MSGRRHGGVGLATVTAVVALGCCLLSAPAAHADFDDLLDTIIGAASAGADVDLAGIPAGFGDIGDLGVLNDPLSQLDQLFHDAPGPADTPPDGTSDAPADGSPDAPAGATHDTTEHSSEGGSSNSSSSLPKFSMPSTGSGSGGSGGGPGGGSGGSGGSGSPNAGARKANTSASNGTPTAAPAPQPEALP